MLVRVFYALLLAVALLAIWAGLYPSVLTVGALVAAPLALIALVGVIAPGVVQRRRWLRRASAIGAALLGLEIVSLAGWFVISKRRPVLLVAHDPLPQRVRIIYNVHDGQLRKSLAWGRRFDVPENGVVYSQYGMDRGSFRPNNPHPLTIVVRRGSGESDTVAGAWQAGGSARSGTCALEYDEYSFGHATSAEHSSSTSQAKARGRNRYVIHVAK